MFTKLTYFTAVVLIAVAILNEEIIVSGQATIEYRLPQNVRPVSYDLTQRMVLDENDHGFEEFTAPGNVTIRFNITKETSNITLNSQYILIEENAVQLTESGSNTPVSIEEHSYDPALLFYTIHTSKPLEAGKQYSVFIPFVSQILTNDTLGLYRGYYSDSLEKNITKNMATTFFEPFGGRRAFPCFDEPDLKAKFYTRIGRETKYHTLTNMDLNNTVADPNYEGWEWDQFNPSVPMSTYTVCLVVSDFKYAQAKDSIFPGKPVKVWGTPAAIQEGGGDYAADMGAYILNWYENYTGIPYALPKMDSIAIPQFAAGAMENWGLNTYRDYLLIYKPETDPDTAKIGVAETLSHELSHQWFGNLATCKWWDQMWLNEGLATFFTYKALLTITPEFDTEMRYLTKHQFNALKFDSNPNKSHPVVIPTDGFNFFDGTSMEKGGALTRMMEYIFTKPVLKIGLRLYLERASFLGAVQDDLFQAMQDAIEQQNVSNVLPPNTSVKDVMDSWTLQTGYPLIRVRRENRSLIFTQENIIPSQSNHSWWVPIKVVTQDRPSFASHISDLWIPPTEVSASYPREAGGDQGDWAIVNPDSAGFYRVLYDNTSWELIQKQLEANPESFTEFTRAQLIDDATNLAMQKFVPLSYAIQSTAYLPQEKNIGVLTSAVKNIHVFVRKFRAESDFPKEVLLNRLEEVLKTLPVAMGTGASAATTNILRNDILKVLCEFGSSSCAVHSKKFLQKIKANPQENVVPVNAQDSMYCGIVATGGKEAWDHVNNLHASESNFWSSKYLAKALGCTTDPELIQRALTKVTNKSQWLNTMENRILPLIELVKSEAGREAYLQSALLQSQDPEDSKLVKKVGRFLQENYE